MALGLYDKPDPSGLFTDLSVFTVTFDGRRGGSFERKIYLRNDNGERWYSNIQLQPIDTAGADIVNGANGFSWKLIEKDVNPTPEEWDEVTAGNQLSFGVTLGALGAADIITFLPIWVRITIPDGQSIQAIKDVVFRIDAMENIA